MADLPRHPVLDDPDDPDNPYEEPGENKSLSSPINELESRLLRNRKVLIFGAINDRVARDATARILAMAEESTKPIDIYINSPGGSISAGMAIYDTMRFVGNDVATVALGLAGSMAQLLLCAGTPGKRYALPHARIIMHQPHGGFGGTASDIAIQARSMLDVKRTVLELIAHHSGRPYEEIVRDADRDRWFTAEEAKAYGLIDHVITTAAEIGSTASV